MTLVIPPEYEQDFFDTIQGLEEDIAAHQEKIYRQIEQNVIAVWKQIQIIQGHIIASIAKSIPSRLPEPH